jgi:Ca2+-binding RTX toxin-like protein
MRREGDTVGCKTLGASLIAGAIVVSGSLFVGVPAAQAKNGDTHITGQGINQTLDCNDSALIVVGTGNNITAVGTCWGVSVQGSSNIVVVDDVVNDITVYGFDQTVLYHNGEPAVLDRGRELGMTNRIDRLPA